MAVLAFAFGAGMLATVNPCGFAMLPAFIAYCLGVGEQDHLPGAGRGLPGRVRQGVGVGLAISVGFAGVVAVAAGLVALGLRQVVTAVAWAAVGIGGLLVVAGVALAAGREFGLRPAAGMRAAGRGGRGWRQVVAFGAAYAVASLSCTLGVVLAVVAQATATANLAQTLAVLAA